MHTFEISGRQFALEQLSVRESLKGLPILTESVLPILSAGLAGMADPGLIRTVVHGLERLPELVDLFAKRCTFEHDKGNGNLVRVGLETFLDVVFKGKTADLLAWLIACIEYQYADFLPGTGPSPLGAKAAQLASRLGLIGVSGGSSATAESPTD